MVVVGHTDTMGAPRSNVELGSEARRHGARLLVAAGLDPATDRGPSHGEADLLIQTPDDTPEPRNRRVEITVR